MFMIWHCKTTMFFPQISMVFLDICHPQKWPLVIARQGFYTGTESHSGCTDDREKAFIWQLETPFLSSCQQGTPTTWDQQLPRFQELEGFKDFKVTTLCQLGLQFVPCFFEYSPCKSRIHSWQPPQERCSFSLIWPDGRSTLISSFLKQKKPVLFCITSVSYCLLLASKWLLCTIIFLTWHFSITITLLYPFTLLFCLVPQSNVTSMVWVLRKSLANISLLLPHSYPSHPNFPSIFSLDPFLRTVLFPIWMGATATASKDKQVSWFCTIPGKQRAQVSSDRQNIFLWRLCYPFQTGRQVRIGF